MVDQQPIVSKIREKRTKSRERQGGRAPAAPVPWNERAGLRVGIGLLLWVAAVVLMSADPWGRPGQPDPSVCIHWIGTITLLLVGLFVAALGLAVVRPGILTRTSTVLLLCLIAFVALIPVKLIIYVEMHTQFIPAGVTPFLFPMAVAPILATLLLEGAAGIAVGLWVTLAVCLFSGAGVPLFLSGLVATVVSASMSHRTRTRARVVRTGLAAGLAQVSCVFGATALHASHSSVTTVIDQAAACIGGGFVAAVLALLLLPLFESPFRITSDITLLELSDLSHPLLERLAFEAPGTYHHSLVVANLAQAAADEIDANSLQARVCAYFHDIGKLYKPAFFMENIRANQNPHDRLSPSMSTLVITSHVKEGVSLAIHHKLPQPVIDVIREHHGTSLVSYFHNKAKAEMASAYAASGDAADLADTVEEWNFRYPGPKPSTRESAIIGLADPIEAASRSMAKITPGSLRDLVENIVNVRLEDGQLDHCQLTLEELARIKNSFVFTLASMLHARTPYPQDEDRDKQSSKTLAHQPAHARLPDDVLYG